MKNILLPTDFSQNSKNAIAYALQLFQNEVCVFYVLNVQKAYSYTTDDLMVAGANQSVHQSVLSDNKQTLKTYVNELREQYPSTNYTFKSLADYDVFTAAIQQAVHAKSINLIVMGSNGATSTSEVVFGSNTLNVIRKVTCPVLVIPKGFKYRKPKNILYAIDEVTDFSETVLHPLKAISSKNTSNIRVLNIKDDDVVTIQEYENKKSIQKYFKDHTHTFHSIVNIATSDAITAFVQLMAIDMTAIVLEKDTFLKRLFHGSTTAKINYTTEVPLLIMHPQ